MMPLTIQMRLISWCTLLCAIIFGIVAWLACSMPPHQMPGIVLWLCSLLLLTVVATGFLFMRRRLKQLDNVSRFIRRIPTNRFDTRIPDFGTTDEIGQIVSAVNEMMSRLEVSFGELRQFSADASHELKTPLTIVRSELERALDERTGPDEIRQIVAGCLDETLRMSALVDHLLLLAQGDAGMRGLRKERIDVSAMMNELYEETAEIASVKTLTVTRQISPGAVIVGDRQLLRQMLLNLIDNAIKYNKDGGVVHLALASEHGQVIISVRDSGIGISPEHLGRIFDRFYQVHRTSSREVGGVGLGLPIAKWIAAAHGGSISVTSIANEMTEFRITIPAEPVR
jgi:signal transduction histidine kinase